MSAHPTDILLVEDSPPDAELTLRALKRAGLDRKVQVAANGERALELLLGEGLKPKVVLLDIKMPRMDGHEVLARLRADHRTRRLPVVMLTTSRHDPDIQRSYELGANSYVVKPLDYEEFSRTVSELGQYWVTVNQEPPA